MNHQDDDRTLDSNKASEEASGQAIQVRCPNCHETMDVSTESSFQQICCSHCKNHFSLVDGPEETRPISKPVSLGHFELIEPLGTGGFGTVWKARDTLLDRIVAVKVPRQGQLSSSESEKFLREARAAAQLRHPNIVAIHEIGRADHSVYIVCDFVEGVALSEWLAVKRPTAREAAQLCAKVADALEHSHQAGVVHRDLKPQNILLDGSGEPHVADFGLARREFGEVTMTIDGQVLGTPSYMSPEQASGKSHGADSRSDIYSLGVILFRLLTGELPFRGSANMLMHQVLHEEPPKLRKLDNTVSRDLETICLKCLEKDPSRRYQSAGTLAEELGRFLRGEPILARPIGPMTRTWRWCKRNPSIAGLLATVGCVLVAGILVATYQKGKLAVVSSDWARIATDALAKREETEGYRTEIWNLIADTNALGKKYVDQGQLRRAAVAAMGDFAGLTPTECAPFEHEITAIGMHPDGLMLAVGLSNGDIGFIDSGGKPVLPKISAHDHQVIELAFDERGNELISIDGRGGIRHWKSSGLHTWKPNDDLTVEFAPAGIRSAQLSSALNYLLITTDDGVSLIPLDHGPTWSRQTDRNGQERARLAACSSDARFVAIAYAGNAGDKLEVVDLGNPHDNSYELTLPDLGKIDALTFSEDSRHFVCGCEQGLVHYDMILKGDEGFEFVQRPVVRTDAIQALAFSRDNQFLASIDIRGAVTVRSVSNDEELAVVAHRPKGRPKFQYITFSPDGSYLVGANLDSLKFWHFNGVSERKVFSGHREAIPTVAFSPRGNFIVTGGKDERVIVWDYHGEKLSELPLPNKVQCVTVDASGKWIATAQWGGPDNNVVQVWSLDVRGNLERSTPALSIEHELHEVNRLVFFDHSSRLAAAGDKAVMYWDIRPSLAREDRLDAESRTVFDATPAELHLEVNVSSDEKYLAYSARLKDGSHVVRIWDLVEERPEPCSAPPMLQGWHGLAFIPESHELIFVNREGVAEIWDIDKDEQLPPLAGNTVLSAPHLALSKRGRWFAGLVKPNVVGIWDLKSRQRVFDLRPERIAIWSLAWSPDETRLALGLSDGGLTVWNLGSVNEQLAALGLNWREVNSSARQASR